MTGEPSPGSPGELPAAVYSEMAATLRAGLAVALAILAGGIIALAALHAGSPSGGWVLPNPLVRLLDPRTLAAGLAAGSPEAYLTVGVYALVATPVVRVGTGVYSFFRHGERRMGLVTTVVLAMLVLGLLVIGPLIR